MIALARNHPALRSLGACAVLVGKLKSSALAVFGIIAKDAADSALQTVELVREIGTDAEHLEARLTDALADGVVTAEESAALRSLILEIRDEATTGRIIA